MPQKTNANWQAHLDTLDARWRAIAVARCDVFHDGDEDAAWAAHVAFRRNAKPIKTVAYEETQGARLHLKATRD